MILSDFLGEALHFLRPGELRGSYTDQDLIRMGFRRASNGAWYMDQSRWERLVAAGQLREDQPLQERVSSRLYHYTNLYAGTQAVETGRFELSSTLGTDIEQQYAPPGYPYFLSATRTLTGGYHDYVGSSAVMFVLAGDWFNARYPGRAVDYWGNRDPLKMHHRRHEAEDRIFSRKSTIPLGGVESVHVLVKPDAEPTHRARARRLLIAAKRRSIPAYLYSDEQAWRRLDTGNTAAVSTLQGADTSGRAWARGHRGYLMPWMELLFGRDQARLSKRADQLRYSLSYSRDIRDAVRGLGTDLSNARKPNSGPDREHAVKIIDLMRRERLQTLADLVNWTRDRWTKKAAVQEQHSQISYHVKTPGQIKPGIRRQLADLIVSGSEVSGNQVATNLAQAALIAWAADGDRPVGVVVLKRPQSSYQSAVFQRAGAADQAQDYDLELGYVYVEPQYRSQGVSAQLLRTMNRSIHTPVFATSRANNRAVNAILRWAGFDTVGRPWDSARGNYQLMLWTRGGPVSENFADGRIRGKSRPGRVKRAGASCKGSVTDLRKRAKKYSGERGRMYHWCANMKSGRAKSNK